MGKVFKKYQILCIYLLLALVTIAVFWQVGNFDFISFDDWEYVTENEHVRTGFTLENVIWAFTETYSFNWHPLTWLSHMIDCELFGLNAAGHHLTNLLLHVVNTLLLFAVLKRMTGALWQSVFVAAAFAIHPLHIESVAWVAERKDVLSTLFWILTMGAYLGYVNKPCKNRYVLVLALFALGLLAKPMLVTLPLVLLLLDYWPLGRFQKASHHENTGRAQKAIFGHLFLEKVPLLALSAGSCAATFFAQQKGGAVTAISTISVDMRITNALFSYGKYIRKMFWPNQLAIFYPHPGDKLPLWMVVLVAMLLFAISIWVIKLAKKRGYLAVGWFWYVITLLPVIGLVQVGGQAMADRYTYVPLIGLFIIIGWGAADFAARWRHRKILLTVSALIVLSAMGVTSGLQLRHWRNTMTVFQHALKVTDNNHIAYLSLAKPLYQAGKIEQAIEYYRRVLQINPYYLPALNNLGIAYGRQGNLDQAIAEFNKILEIDPEFTRGHFNLGYALMRQDKLDEAVENFRQALRLEPDNSDTLNNMAWILSVHKSADYHDPNQAIGFAERACELTGYEQPAVLDTLACAYAASGRFLEAVATTEKALELARSKEQDQRLIDSIQNNLNLFQAGKPYYEE